VDVGCAFVLARRSDEVDAGVPVFTEAGPETDLLDSPDTATDVLPVNPMPEAADAPGSTGTACETVELFTAWRASCECNEMTPDQLGASKLICMGLYRHSCFARSN